MGKEKVALIFIQDPGGVNNVMPVYKEFKAMCPDVLPVIIASGDAPAILKKLPGAEAMVLKDYKDISDVFDEYPDPILVVASMDSGASLGRNAMPIYCDVCPTVAIPDTPWGRYKSFWRDPEFWPAYLIVNDEVCRRVALDIWQGFPAKNVVISPWPFLDRFQSFDTTQAGEFLAKHCAISNYPIVLFVGQLDGTADVLVRLVEALNATPGNYYFIPRLHPRASEEEQDKCTKALKALKREKNGRLILNTADFGLDPINYAARVTISVHSIALVEKAAMRGYCISLQTQTGLNVYHKDIGMRPERPPYAEMGICDAVWDMQELQVKLHKALQSDFVNPLAPRQAQVLPVDGQNAQRVAQFLRGLIA